MIISLLKNEFRGLVSNINTGENPKKNTLPLHFIALTLIFFYLSYGYSDLIAQSFLDVNLLEILPLLFYTFCFSSLLFLGIFHGSSVLFQCKDHNLLASLPIEKNKIILSKFLYLYLIQLYFTVILLVPSYFHFFKHSKVPSSFVLLLSSIIVTPIIPLILSLFVGMWILQLSRHFRGKSIFVTVSTFISLFILIKVTSQTYSMEQIYAFSQGFQSNIYKILPWAVWIFEMQEGNYTALYYFTGFSLILSYFFLKYVTGSYDSINHSLNHSKTTQSSKKALQSKAQKPFVILLKKEWKTLATHSIYAINTLFTPLTAVGFILYILFNQEEILLYSAIYRNFTPFLPLSVGVILSLSPTTACSISLEGKQLWILQNLPIPPRDILLSKVAFQCILNLPVCFLLSCTLSYVCQFDVVWTVIMLLFPCLFCLFINFSALLLNIEHPNFTWTNPAVVVKQGLPMLLNLVYILVITALLSYVFYKIGNNFQNVARVYFIFIFLLMLRTKQIYESILTKETIV